MRSFSGVFLVTLLLLNGCRGYRKEIVTGYPVRFDNVYVDPAYDHSQLVNVLLLPLDNPMQDSDVQLHQKRMVRSITRNFGKFGYFNLYNDRQFGESAGRVVDLDSGEVDRVKLGEVGRQYHVQAVMKISVEEFRPFLPMRLRLKAALIDVNEGKKVWSFDQVFDGEDAEIVNGMRTWWNTRVAGGDVRSRFEESAIRPSAFSSYALYMMARSYGAQRIKNFEAIGKQGKKELRKEKKVAKLQKIRERKIIGQSRGRPSKQG